jgi:hypothetical protein
MSISSKEKNKQIKRNKRDAKESGSGMNERYEKHDYEIKQIKP